VLRTSALHGKREDNAPANAGGGVEEEEEEEEEGGEAKDESAEN
jgi:hypothetical protein